MRKQYSSPCIQIITIDSKDIIATSPGLSNQPSNTGNWNLGREDSFWDDEF